MSLITRPLFDADLSFTPFFRFLDDFNNYSRDMTVPSFTPRFDIQEKKHAYTLQGELPGIDKKDTLTIHGRTTSSYESPKEGEQTENGKIWRSERKVGEFSRSFCFPDKVDQDGVKATMKDGILSLEVPKMAKGKEKKRIAVD